MNRSRLFTFLSLVVIAAVLGCGGGGSEQAKVENEDELAASVEDWTLTKDQLYDIISKLPPQQQEEYSTPGGKADIAGKLMDEEMFYLEAKREGLEKRSWVQKQIEASTRQILIAAYYRDYVDAEARPTDEEIHDYYEENADRYTSLAVLRAQHVFSKDKKKLEDIKQRIVEGGEKLTTMAHKYSEDKLTRADGGDLGFFNPGGYIRGIGYSQVLNDSLLTMEVGKIYGPIKWERGYSLIRLNEKRPAELRPYDEVKDEISNLLTKEKVEDVKKEVVAKISKNYTWRNYMQEYYETVQKTPQELFEYAQNSPNSKTRIEAFQEIVDKFPDDAYAPQALFMIGFVYAEEEGDKVMADHTFNDLLRRYPDSDVAESARWMLANMDKPLPKFQDLDELNQKIKDDE
jgi:peptidyl-prolyl cis-trans isomerase C